MYVFSNGSVLGGLVDVPRRQRDNGRAIARRKPGVLLLFPVLPHVLNKSGHTTVCPYYAYELEHYVCITQSMHIVEPYIILLYE